MQENNYRHNDTGESFFSYETGGKSLFQEEERLAAKQKEKKRKKGKAVLIIIIALLLAMIGGVLYVISSRDQERLKKEEAENTIPFKDSYRYFRDTLSGRQLEIYDILLTGIVNHKEEIFLEPEDEELIHDTVRKLVPDNPDCFWFLGKYKLVRYVYYTYGNIDIQPEYTMNTALSEHYQGVVDDYVATIEKNTEGMTDYQKVKYAYEYIIENSKYDLSVEDQSCLSIITKGKSTCAGYTTTLSTVLNRLGIPTTICLGYALERPHSWNLVKLNGNWYHVDATFGDPIIEDGSDWIIYDYFLITDDEIFKDHEYEQGLTYPKTGPVLEEKLQDTTLTQRQTTRTNK